MKENLVSIIVPCYNGQEFLSQALESIAWQTYANWECLLIDDGSTDRSPEIFQDFARDDERFRYHRQNNSGPSVARNTGIELARGEFIQFLDDDDLIPENRLDRCVETFHLHENADVVYTDYVCYQKELGFFHTLPARIPEGDLFLNFLLEQNRSFVVLMHSFLFKKEVIRRHRFDPSLVSYAEDFECWVRIAEGGARFEYVDEVLAIYRYSADSLGSNELALLKAKVDVLDRYSDHPKVKARLGEFRNAYSYFNEHHVIGYFKQKRFREGVPLMRKQWRSSRWRGRIKMLVWLTLMRFFSVDSVVAVRAWILKYTPFAWGGWAQYKQWVPPAPVRLLIFSRQRQR